MLPGMLYIFLPLVFGYLITIKNANLLEKINTSTSRLVFIILGLMGLSLAGLDDLFNNLNQILLLAVTFFLCIGVANLLALPLLDKVMRTETKQHKREVPLSHMIMESVKLVFVVAGGLILGLILPIGLNWVDPASEAILLVLLFLIGIQLRNSGMSLKQIIINKKGMSIALVIILTSWLGGLLAAWLLDLPYNYGLAMASGFGWYSLAGILMGDSLGPIYGGASFLLELARELVAIILIPLLIARYPLTAIGYGGATAMDFTLPIIQTTGGVKCVPIAIVSGFILSLLVPILMLFFVAL
ncbi:lysine exporter LysO family protein [Enterovibrio paralichthyis]|uniref:lysine exporter LysO family protein n=1 Tax=Enterovibrio paralichthyis TaxID=2853805 RepID=UPI001C4648CF|nr:lysine exporter LysO family protein [Enterovibrio paralichthyis]MBV7299245.1 lysine exporter LysO family protein [Enterovibrio paralichthyis]